MHNNIETYFGELSAALLGTRVTDYNGSALTLAVGMQGVLECSPFRVPDRRQEAGGKVMLVGNGGSAAIASHAQNDLCKAVGTRAMVFNETSLLTALTNDIDYASAFEALVCLWAQPGDLLFAISSSGRSENILRAARAARDLGCTVVSLSGFRPDNPLRTLGDLNFYVAAQSYGVVELSHAALLHYMTDQAQAIREARQTAA